MDIFSHGLWAGVVAKGVNKAQRGRRVNVWAAMLWGVFPDLFAFSIPFVFIVWSAMLGDHSFGGFGGRPPITEPTGSGTLWLFQLSHVLYNMSHSIVIFTVVFLGVWAYFKQVRVELLGWLLHIVMDVPTHTYAFFPTPVLWPLFDWKFNGIHWGQWWFIIADYSLLLLVYVFVKQRRVAIFDKKD